MSSEGQGPDRDAGRCPSLLAAMVLLVCVTAVLAGLFVRERNRRLDAERRYVELRRSMQDQLQQIVGGSFPLGGLPSQPATAPSGDNGS